MSNFRKLNPDYKNSPWFLSRVIFLPKLPTINTPLNFHQLHTTTLPKTAPKGIMIGKPTVTVKPSRSDEVIDSDQQLKISEKVRSHFDSILPKRPLKPNRSDPDHVSPESHSDEPVSTIPELIKFHSLIAQSQGVVSDGNPTIDDEFVETGYYKELFSIDKQHHTTGKGFIKVAMSEGSRDDDELYNIGLKIGSESGYRYRYSDGVSISNPATNDWIPSSGDYYDQGEYTSWKPNRSENG